MPSLVFVTACEKVIIDQTGPISLISVFQRMNIQIQADSPLPTNAVAPNQWAIVCLWENFPKEVGQDFTQVLHVLAPDGMVFIEREDSFRNDDVDSSQTKLVLRFNVLPIWSEGDIVIKVWIKGLDEPVGSYRFSIRYLLADASGIAPPQST